MKKTLKLAMIFCIGLIMGIIISILIIEKELYFWHIGRDRDMIRLEIRKINLERQEIDDLIQSLKRFMKGIDEASEKEGK